MSGSKLMAGLVGPTTVARLVAGMTLRPDMASQFEARGRRFPAGPTWAVMVGDRTLGVGGLEPQGAAASAGWLLVSDGLTVRDWAVGRRAIRKALDWSRQHAIRRVRVLVDAGQPGAHRLMRSLGFEATDRDGDGIIMTLELAGPRDARREARGEVTQ